ncbi:MAG TPA: hypothetical protein VJH24_00455 [Candidatus Bilamarchaeaceae archaeon]|nr:hypothetical protein [Candidatus Bilamarchaeaceae archaeon]
MVKQARAPRPKGTEHERRTALLIAEKLRRHGFKNIRVKGPMLTLPTHDDNLHTLLKDRSENSGRMFLTHSSKAGYPILPDFSNFK